MAVEVEHRAGGLATDEEGRLLIGGDGLAEAIGDAVTTYLAAQPALAEDIATAVAAQLADQDAEVKFASISKTATGDLVNAVVDKKIRVLGYFLTATAAFDLNFESGTSDISGVMHLAANGQIAYSGGRDAPAFETAVNTKLALTLSGTGQVSGHLSYIEV